MPKITGHGGEDYKRRSTGVLTGLPDAVFLPGIFQHLLSQLEIVKVTLTIFSLCSLVHQMEVVEARMVCHEAGKQARRVSFTSAATS